MKTKKIFLFFFFLFGISLTSKSYSQISVTKGQPKEKTKKLIEYNSLLNIDESILKDETNKNRYYGLHAFFAPIDVLMSKIDRYKFHLYSQKPEYSLNRVFTRDKGWHESEAFSFEVKRLEKIAGRKFKILETINVSELDRFFKKEKDSLVARGKIPVDNFYHTLPSKNYGGIENYLKIENVTNKEVYYLYPSSSNDFVLENYHNYLKENYIGKSVYIASINGSPSRVKTLDNKNLFLSNKSKWLIEELTYLNIGGSGQIGTIYENNTINRYQLIMILSNDEIGKIPFFVNSKNKNPFAGNTYKMMLEDDYKILIEKNKLLAQKREKEQKLRIEELTNLKVKERQELINKYGSIFGKLISERKVEIGMNKEMCLKSWGLPLDKKTTVVNNEKITIWIYYGYNKLLFRNDKLYAYEF